MKTSNHILLTMMWLLMSAVSFGQTADPSSLHHIEKRYNIFFPINSSYVDSTFSDNSHTIETIRQDIRISLVFVERKRLSKHQEVEAL